MAGNAHLEEGARNTRAKNRASWQLTRKHPKTVRGPLPGGIRSSTTGQSAEGLNGISLRGQATKRRNSTYRTKRQIDADAARAQGWSDATHAADTCANSSPRVTSREEADALVAKNYRAVWRIAANHCRPVNCELHHVSGFNVDEVCNEVCIQLLDNWRSVPREPGFYPFAKTLASHWCNELWKKQQRRAKAFVAHKREIAYVR